MVFTGKPCSRPSLVFLCAAIEAKTTPPVTSRGRTVTADVDSQSAQRLTRK
jgi:hypothetical protein